MFIIELQKNGFVLIPEQSNHYGNHNGVIPHLYVTYIEQEENNILKIVVHSYMLLVGVFFVLVCALMCIVMGKLLSGILVFVVANTILQLAFWLPCKKALAELQRIMDG